MRKIWGDNDGREGKERKRESEEEGSRGREKTKSEKRKETKERKRSSERRDEDKEGKGGTFPSAPYKRVSSTAPHVPPPSMESTETFAPQVPERQTARGRGGRPLRRESR